MTGCFKAVIHSSKWKSFFANLTQALFHQEAGFGAKGLATYYRPTCLARFKENSIKSVI
ncbi:MAG: hypothetical protein Q7T03_06050 [Deltaproteobacteria bacterium]|nr:hypothetical protein [Deltaproteobacteria bacterium]